MALGDTLLNQLRKNAEKNGDTPTTTSGLKSKAAMIISIFAAIFSVNAFIGSQLSSSILNNTIAANDIYSFYQAKSIKQTMAEYAQEDAVRAGDKKRGEELQVRIDRYESDPVTGEGKQQLMARARSLENSRDQAKKHSPWLTFSGSALQLSIVLLSASILAVSMGMFYASIGVGLIGAVLMSQGIWLWFPL
jgi:hypothetical protein